MGGKRFYRLASDLRHTPGNEDESRESCREGGGGHALLFRSGIYATLLNSREDYGSGHDQEEHAGNGPTLNPEPETNSRTIVGAKSEISLEACRGSRRHSDPFRNVGQLSPAARISSCSPTAHATWPW